MTIKKYLTIIKVYWQRAITYRFTVFTYRIGEIAELLVLILLWSAIYNASAGYSGQQLIQGYTLNQMITYVLIGNLFTSLTRNFLSDVIARDIREGRLSAFLIKPIPYFQFMLFREIGRISIATFMSVLSQVLVLSFFYKIIIINSNPLIWIILFLMILLTFFTEILLSFLVGLLAF